MTDADDPRVAEAGQALFIDDNNELQQDLKRQSSLKYLRLYGYGGWIISGQYGNIL